MYADVMTNSMKKAIEETKRRRSLQEKYNEEHGITPTTIKKAVRDLISIAKDVAKTEKELDKAPEDMSRAELGGMIEKIEKQMRAAAAELNFEMAAELRDQMVELKKNLDDAEDTERRIQKANRRTAAVQPKRTYKTYNKNRGKNRGGMA